MTEQLITTESDTHWYIIHTYSGQEDRVKRNLELRIESMDVKDKIFQVVVPTEEEIEIKEGQRKSVQRKIFPRLYISSNGDGRPKLVCCAQHAWCHRFCLF